MIIFPDENNEILHSIEFSKLPFGFLARSRWFSFKKFQVFSGDDPHLLCSYGNALSFCWGISIFKSLRGHFVRFFGVPRQAQKQLLRTKTGKTWTGKRLPSFANLFVRRLFCDIVEIYYCYQQIKLNPVKLIPSLL